MLEKLKIRIRISRVLFQMIIYLELLSPIISSGVQRNQRVTLSFLNLASNGVYTVIQLPIQLVGSYPTIPPIAQNMSMLFLFCCTCLEVAFTSRQLAFCSVMLGLSSDEYTPAIICTSNISIILYFFKFINTLTKLLNKTIM